MTKNLPDLLRLTDPVRKTLGALPASTAVIGVGTDGQPVTVDLDGAPHILVSTYGGGGSSTILRTLTAQLLHQGAHALILDYKRISQTWARQLPTVTYRADVADIHDALTGLAAELRRRIDVVDRHGSDVGLLRLVVVFENGDATLRKLARHWETVRRPGDPKVSPAFTALTDVLFAGAMVRMNVLFDGHPTLSVLGPEGREQFSTVILGQVPTGTWRRFAPAAGTAPKDRGRPHRGRVHVIQRGDTVHQTQVLTLTDPEALGRAAGAC
ncbi:FtsK/SpoIIIE domain-containing protein [Streptomyces sp. NPDC002755]|uniref:FtsK/SpoIIIE domain-containing protein n=1 Tax=Streptomyces sp. NPDC002884 TaxID=3154544 RepID=UPI0033167B43